MEGLLQRTVLLSLIALLFASCITTSTPPDTTGTTELRRLPAESKIYFRQRISIPARTDRVWLVSEPGVHGLKADLAVPAAEIDRLIDPSTPLLVDRIESPAKSRRGFSCTVTLHLKTPGGVVMKLRASRAETAAICSPLTVGDFEGVAMIVLSPPVPIQ